MAQRNDARRSPATMRDVALRAGVSRQTVSNVLNSPGRVRQDTQDRVNQAIQDLGYRPNLGARRLRTNESRTIAVRLEPYQGGISGVILDRFLHALTVGAARANHRILVHAAESMEDEVREVIALAAEQEIDAVVLTSTFPGDPRGTALREAGVRYVSFGRPWGTQDMETSDWVDVDGATGTGLATRAAITATGRPAAYLGWPSAGGTGADRERGWQQATIAAGFEPTTLRIYAEEDVSSAKDAIRRALEQGLLREANSIVCASDLLAVGASLALRDSGREDIRVTGFDNTPTSEALSFSSVEQHPERVAEAVLRLLLQPDAQPRQLLVDPELIVRDSRR